MMGQGLASAPPLLFGLNTRLDDRPFRDRQSFCGHAVRFMDDREPPPVRTFGVKGKGCGGLRAFRAERNTTSLDGLPAGIDAKLRDRP